MFACRSVFGIHVLIAFFVVLFSAVFPVSAQPAERPFLIVRGDMYGELRDRASRELWAGIAKKAVKGAERYGYRPGWSFLYTCERLNEFTSAAALAYILTEDERRNGITSTP